jgi:hypothetical protein
VLGTDIYEIFTEAPWRLVRERLFKTAVLRSSWNDQFYCGKRPSYQARLPKAKRIFLKQDQSGIVAQIFLLCGKVRERFFANQYSEPAAGALSSSAMVTAAKTVQRGESFLGAAC